MAHQGVLQVHVGHDEENAACPLVRTGCISFNNTMICVVFYSYIQHIAFRHFHDTHMLFYATMLL